MRTKIFLSFCALLMVIGSLLGLAVPKAAAQEVCGYPTTAPLLTSDGTTYGTLRTWNTDNKLYTTVTANSGWVITRVSLHNAGWYSAIPKTSGGSFDWGAFTFQRTYASGVASDTIEGPLNWDYGDDLHLAVRVA